MVYVVIEKEDNAFVAYCPTLPECASRGATYNEAYTNINEAISGYLTSMRKHNAVIPDSAMGRRT